MLYILKPSDFDQKVEIVSCLMQFDGKILFLLRQDHKTYPNAWGPPAGKVKQSENINDAIIREVKEETGIDIDEKKLKYLRKNYVRHPGFDFIYHEYFYKLDELPDIKISIDEHKDFGWFLAEESLELELVKDQDKCIKQFIKYKNIY